MKMTRRAIFERTFQNVKMNDFFCVGEGGISSELRRHDQIFVAQICVSLPLHVYEFRWEYDFNNTFEKSQFLQGQSNY